MRQHLTATIQALDQSELDKIVDPYFKKSIKDTDPDPEIRVYSVSHEGKANLNLPGIGPKTLTWVQAAVQWVADALHVGTPVFNRHDPNTNSHTGRTKIGEVVGKTVKRIGDHLNTLAAIYIHPEFKSRPLDIASFEAEIEYSHDGFQAWPTAVKDVSGIALSNSGIDTPGFPGATLLGAVQAYVQAFGGEIGDKPMNVSDVKQAVKDLGITPSQLFGVDDIVGDSKVSERIKEEKKNVIAGSERIQRERDDAKEKVLVLEGKVADAGKHVQQLQMSSKSSTVIEGILADPERKLTDKAKVFVKRGLKNFSSEAVDEDGLKVDLGKFVDGAAKEYGELAKDVFGVVAEDPPKGTANQFEIPKEFTVGGQPPTDQQRQVSSIPETRNTVLTGEMNSDVNPLIPGGKAAQEASTT